MKANWLFLSTVLVPTVLAIIYFGFLASDVYVSESRFVLRSPERQTSSPLGSILQGAGFSRAQDDSYSVQDYMLSRDALLSLEQRYGLKAMYSSADIDRISRFAGIDWDDSFEALYDYYRSRIKVGFDPLSSITTLTTRAYTAEDSYRINRHLLEQSEALVNQINTRGRRDMIRFALSETEVASRKARDAALALAAYRNAENLLDPEKQSAIPLQQISRLQDELLLIRAQVLQIESLAAANPQLPTLRQRGRLIEREIKSLTESVAGASNRSLASRSAEYQRLALEVAFADKMLANAMNALSQAKNEAQRKQLYLERIVQPSEPDSAQEPRRLRAILAVFGVGLLVWGVLAMLIAGIREHQD